MEIVKVLSQHFCAEASISNYIPSATKKPSPFLLGAQLAVLVPPSNCVLTFFLRSSSNDHRTLLHLKSLSPVNSPKPSRSDPSSPPSIRAQGMGESLKKTLRTAGVRGLFDGISGTWMRQMPYSICRFWAYDESKKILGRAKMPPHGSSPPLVAWLPIQNMKPCISCRRLTVNLFAAGGIVGFVGNHGEIVMVRLQGAFAKPPEKRFNYKHYFDALSRQVVLAACRRSDDVMDR